MEIRNFVHESFSLSYQVWGEGETCVFFFHGFGRQAADAEFFLPLLQPGQRLISVDLFAHGASLFPAERVEELPLLPAEWAALFSAFLLHLKAEKVHLVGYSMGGRIVMMTCLLLPERISSVLLLAPDGIKINLLYRFASGTTLGRRVSQYLIGHPRSLFVLAGLLRRLGLLHEKLYRFVHIHLDTREKRQQVHDAWLIYRCMFPDLEQLGELVRGGKFRFAAVFGKHDRVITPRLGDKLAKTLNAGHVVYQVDLGHRLLERTTLRFIGDHRLWPSSAPESGT